MSNYLIGILFTAFYIAYMYFLGGAVVKQDRSYSYQFLIGYMVFSFFVGIGGIIIQVMNLPWRLFAAYLAIVYLGLAIFALTTYIRRHNTGYVRSDRHPFRSQWFIGFTALALTLVMLTTITYLWQNNSLDDGYYLSWVSSVPYNSETGFFTNPSTGFQMTLEGMGAYIFNTIYTEYSVYVYLLHIKTTVFCRFFMSFFNYYLYGCCVTAFCEFVFRHTKAELRPDYFQFAAAILFLFGFAESFLYNNHLLILQDSWQFNTAMFYGSSIVRTMSIFMIVLPFLDRDQLTVRDVLTVGAIAVVLISKSSIALPLIIIVSLAYLICLWLFSFDKRNYLWILLLLIAMLTISIVLGNNASFESLVHTYFLDNLRSILFWPCVVFFITSFLYHNKYIIRFNCILLIVLALMIVPVFNNIFESASMYNFVAARAFTTFTYTFIVASFSYLLLDIVTLVKNPFLVRRILSAIGYGMCIAVFVTTSVSNNLLDSYEIILENPNVMPESTIKLGEVLEMWHDQTGTQNVVVSSEGLNNVNGYKHSLGVMIRTVSPHSIALSAISRFGEDKMGPYQSYTKDSQRYFYVFLSQPNNDTYQPLSQTVNANGINVLVVTEEPGDSLDIATYSNYLSGDGFGLYAIVEDNNAGIKHYVYTRVV